MLKRDGIIGLVIIVNLGFAYLWHQSQINMAGANPSKLPVKLAVATDSVVGTRPDYLGDTKSPYTLIEFGDYQCPPCSRANTRVEQLILEHKGKIKLTFRNLPLDSIHPQARAAAFLAEAAREQGKFWQMHDALYQNQKNLDAATLRALSSKLHLDPVRLQRSLALTAKAAVDIDIKDSSLFDVEGTPTFILCKPDGQILRLSSLSQAEQILK